MVLRDLGAIGIAKSLRTYRTMIFPIERGQTELRRLSYSQLRWVQGRGPPGQSVGGFARKLVASSPTGLLQGCPVLDGLSTDHRCSVTSP
jgi:hypothetical protein